MACLKVNSINCFYGAQEVIKELTYDFPQGSFVGIIGPNGSGKSTLLNAMARILKPQRGTVLLGEDNIFKMASKEVAKSIGVVPQNTMINFDFTAQEVVLMGRNPYMSRFGWENKGDWDIAEKAMEATGTINLKDKSIGDLSGGERQRVIISRALAQEPEILLLDEPTSHLDITHQIEILQLLTELNEKEKITIIIVIHDLNLAVQYCKELILLKDGKIFDAGPIEKVITEDNIKKVYNTEVMISKHPLLKVPNITLLPKKHFLGKADVQAKSKRIHLVCGGGAGKGIIPRLTEEGYRLSAGVLNKLDLDWQIALENSLRIVEEQPFCPISEASYQANLQLMSEADCIIVVDVPIGHGNLKNLEAVFEAQKNGKEIIILEGTSFKERDFIDGQGESLLNNLVSGGAKIISENNLWSSL